MGLDMYLSAERYFWHNEEAPKAPNNKPVKTLRVEAGYWRKANAIHSWFVEKVQGGEDECNEFEVARRQLEELRETCKKVLEDETKAMELLPPQAGFFFGSTDVNEWYRAGLEQTVQIIDECLDPEVYPPEEWDFYYRASW